MAKRIDWTTYDPRKRSNDGAWIPIKLGGEPIDFEIRVQGRLSSTYTEISRAAKRHQQEVFRKTKEIPLMTPEEQDEQQLALAVACSAGWRGDDAPGEFSKDAAAKFYAAQPEVFEQIARAIEDDARFLKP